jgi:hypothetical protein
MPDSATHSRYRDRLPIHRLRALREIEDFQTQYVFQNDHAPSLEEMAAALGRSPKKTTEIIADGDLHPTQVAAFIADGENHAR